ncbi:MAG TPA: hypothetical protein VHB46_00875 [Burkholderiales bacterium]|nr:hypothetical protein [Burkholderiales bacterium]
MKNTRLFWLAACVLVGFSAGCASNAKKSASAFNVEKDVSRVVKLGDGTICTEPEGLGASRQSKGAVQLKELLDSEAKADDIVNKAKGFKPAKDEVEAVYFDSCRAYSNKEIDKEAFDKSKTVYYGLRQQLFAQDIKNWQEKKEGFADAGKLCLVLLPDTDPDKRSFTRVIPLDATVDDCAQYAIASGSAEIQLGCTKGHWNNNWAKSPIGITASAAKHQLSAKGSSHLPDPNCGWN